MAFVHADRGSKAGPGAGDSVALLDAAHEALCGLVAEMMGAVLGAPPPRPHLSFLGIGGSEAQAAELAEMVNALFGVSLPSDGIARSPTPDALARTIMADWFDGRATAADLIELIDAIAAAD